MATFLDYELLDCGNGLRWERFGNNQVIRPEAIAIWKPFHPLSQWRGDAICKRGENGRFVWEKKSSFSEPWQVKLDPLRFELRFSHSKNVGLFPEQLANWEWIARTLLAQSRPLSLLNLFGYTGAATLVAARHGATVCHVDASKSAIQWASLNRSENQMEHLPIRWIIDDCMRFVEREIRRQKRYDGIILDPPAFGRGSEGSAFTFESEVPKLLEQCRKILPERPALFLFNGYAMRYSPWVVHNLIRDYYPQEKIESGELTLLSRHQQILPCGIYARFSNRL